MNHRHPWYPAVVASILLAVAASAAAQSRSNYCEAEQIEVDRCVVYDHLAHRFVGPAEVEVGPGDVFYLLIVNTAPAHFLYPVEGIEERFSKESAEDFVALTTYAIAIAHEARFGGYSFSITSNDRARVSTDWGPLTSTPEPRVIVVRTLQWHQSLAGAFTTSSLTDPVFALHPRTASDGTEKQFVTKDSSAEDEATLGLGAFIHLHHSSWDRRGGKGGPALSFGLGLDSDSEVSYYLGPSYRFGDKGAFTIGAVWGPVSRLPGGVRTCGRSETTCADDLAVDPNVLGQLDERNKLGGFFALSYSFLDVADLIEKPFKALRSGMVTENEEEPLAEPVPALDKEAEPAPAEEATPDDPEEDDESGGNDEDGNEAGEGGGDEAGTVG